MIVQNRRRHAIKSLLIGVGAMTPTAVVVWFGDRSTGALLGILTNVLIVSAMWFFDPWLDAWSARKHREHEAWMAKHEDSMRRMREIMARAKQGGESE